MLKLKRKWCIENYFISVPSALLLEILFYLVGKDSYRLLRTTKLFYHLKNKFLFILQKVLKFFFFNVSKYNTIHIEGHITATLVANSKNIIWYRPQTSCVRLNFGPKIYTAPTNIQNKYVFFHEPTQTFFNVENNTLFFGEKEYINSKYYVYWKKKTSFSSSYFPYPVSQNLTFYPVHLYQNCLFLFQICYPALEMIIYNIETSRRVFYWKGGYLGHGPIFKINVNPKRKLVFMFCAAAFCFDIFSYVSDQFVYLRSFYPFYLQYLHFETFYLSDDYTKFYVQMRVPRTSYVLIFFLLACIRNGDFGFFAVGCTSNF